jgi:hypothetical protein
MPNVRNGDHAGKKPAMDHVVPGHDHGEFPADPEEGCDRCEPGDNREAEVGRRVRAAVHHMSIVGPASGDGASE